MPARTRVGRFGRLIAVNALMLAVLGVVAEFSARFVLPRFNPGFHPFERTYPGQYSDRTFSPVSWPRKEPELGWVCRDMADIQFGNRFYTNRVVSYRINPQGFRSRYNFAAADKRSPKQRVVLLGDSFLFGVYLDEAQTITARLEESLGDTHQFYNLAMPGWGVDQMYLAYLKYQEALSPDVVVLLYIDEDVERLYQAFRKRDGMSKPSFAVRDGKLALRTPKEEIPWTERVLNRSVLLTPLHKVYARGKIIEIAELIIKDMGRRAAGAQQRVFVMRCPLLQEAIARRSAPSYDLTRTLREAGITYVDLRERVATLSPADRQKLYLQDDMHFSPQGCRFVADVIAELLAQSAPCPTVGAP